jgi:hypothetical protein
MKKILYFVLIMPLVTVMLTSCESELDELWQNPNKYVPAPEEVTSGLFTHMQKTRFFQEDYGEWYWQHGDGTLPSAIQITGGYYPRANAGTNNLYDSAYTYTFALLAEVEYGTYVATGNNNCQNRFNWLYTDLTNYGDIRDEVNKLTGTEYDNTIIYLKLAVILKDIVALQTVDLFNKIPYFSAFNGSLGEFSTPYDDPEAIYKSIIEEFRAIASELPEIYNKMSGVAKKTFEQQDIFFKGDINKWIKYVNGETLRACVRVSGVTIDGLNVGSIISEVVNGLPDQDYTFKGRMTNRNNIDNAGDGELLTRALYERWNRLTFPDVMMSRMNYGTDKYEPGTDDPRLQLICAGFTPTEDANDIEFYGVSGDKERNRKALLGLVDSTSFGEKGTRRNGYPQKGAVSNNCTSLSIAGNLDMIVKGFPWTYFNPVTFLFVEGEYDICTRAEMDLLLAEVALKGLASTGKTAGDHMYDALIHSTDFWYAMNQAAWVTNKPPTTPLADAILRPATKPEAAAYAANLKSRFDAAAGEDAKMEILMQQKYIHLNMIKPYELFADLRRTRHPKLEPISTPPSYEAYPVLTNQTLVWERFRYPSTQISWNKEEFAKVEQDDNWVNPIFWVPQGKRTESYFLPQAIKR